MRLLNTRTYQLRHFNRNELPPYAILSHTWGREEVTFDDVQAGKADCLHGYLKVLGSCEQAKSDGLDYVVRQGGFRVSWRRR